MTVTEFMGRLKVFVDEIYCDGKRTASHSYPSTVEFMDVDGNAFRIVDIEPRTHLGCGCWTGIEFVLERVPEQSINDAATPPPWWDAERGCYREDVEGIARIIDPEAFGLPAWQPTTGADHMTDRDEARDKAAAIVRGIKDGKP